MDTRVITLLILATLDGCLASLPWDKWSWSLPQEPIEHFFRRYQDGIPLKSPEFECKCPPNKECAVNFKINEDVAEFLHLRGIIKDEDLTEIKEYAKTTSESTAEKSKSRSRRTNEGTEEEQCCCPPRNVMMPTFITDKKFDEVVNRLKSKKTLP
ncbi:uncharacterized protein LOC134199714 [Bombyx mori]|uniref:uncharacterized protein LOC134199714 n=1 Tax=Bombyx mori TaxID=7091 RepID=UPI002ED0E78B